MLKNLEERVSALTQVAQELNSLSDKFSQRLRSIEERLNALNLGVYVVLNEPLRTQISDHDPDNPDQEAAGGEVFLLGYEKVAGTWRIVVQQVYCFWPMRAERAVWGEDDTESRKFGAATPLLDCSRDLRLEAAGQIGQLLDEIERAARERVVSLSNALGSPGLPADSGPPEVAVRSERVDRWKKQQSVESEADE